MNPTKRLAKQMYYSKYLVSQTPIFKSRTLSWITNVTNYNFSFCQAHSDNTQPAHSLLWCNTFAYQTTISPEPNVMPNPGLSKHNFVPILIYIFSRDKSA